MDAHRTSHLLRLQRTLVMNPYRDAPLLTSHSMAPWTAPRAPLWKRVLLWCGYRSFIWSDVRDTLRRWELRKQRERHRCSITGPITVSNPPMSGQILIHDGRKWAPTWLDTRTLQCKLCRTSIQYNYASGWATERCFVCLSKGTSQ
jgi:hypothetical protein